MTTTLKYQEGENVEIKIRKLVRGVVGYDVLLFSFKKQKVAFGKMLIKVKVSGINLFRGWCHDRLIS